MLGTVLWLTLGSAAFHVAPPVNRGVRSPTVRCSLAEERVESGKAGLIAALSGSLCAIPPALVATTAFTPQWEFSTDAIALQLALFGVVYRYAVRSDGNEQLKQGVVGAFAVTRMLCSVQVSTECSAIPLNCGPPLGYLNWDMLLQLGAYFGESAIAFGGAAFALELCWEKGWAAKIPATGLPTADDEDAPTTSE